MRQGLPARALVELINNKIGKTEANVNLIARDQVSKLNGQLTRVRQTSLGVKSYIWRTSLDERVRPTHISKEGKEFNWNEPPSDTGHPGEDYQCRCYAEPVLEKLISTETEERESSGFLTAAATIGAGFLIGGLGETLEEGF